MMSESDGFESAEEGQKQELADAKDKKGIGDDSVKQNSPAADTVEAAGGDVAKGSNERAKTPEKSPATLDQTSTDIALGPDTGQRETTPTRKVQRVYADQKDGAVVKEKNIHAKELLDKLSQPESDDGEKDKEKPSGGWGWGNIGSWGSTVLSTAQTSVTTFSSQVGEGFQTVLDTVESSLGAIDPMEWERMEKADQERISREEALEAEKCGSKPEDGGADGGVVHDQPHKATTPASTTTGEPLAPGAEGDEVQQDWLTSWGLGGISTVVKQTTNTVVQQTTNVVKQTSDVVKQTSDVVKKTMKDTSNVVTEKGKNFVSGSLDVLESIGKKTFDTIAEGDHGLKQTIQATRQKPNLAQLLREAKEDADHRSKQEEEFVEARKSHFGAQFDDFQGLVQLEALEMLSNQCEGRVQGLLTTLKGPQLTALKPELITIKDTFQLEDMDSDEEEDRDHDFDRLLTNHVGQLGLHTTPEKLIQAQEKARTWLMNCKADCEHGTKKDPKEIHQTAIQSLAEFTACAVGQFHKVGQLILLDKLIPLSSVKSKAGCLTSVTRVLCTEVGIMSVKFTQCLNMAAEGADNSDVVNPLITNVYLEATNSSTYIQDAFQMLLPVLQQVTIDAHQREHK